MFKVSITRWDGMSYVVWTKTFGKAMDAVEAEKNLATYKVKFIAI